MKRSLVFLFCMLLLVSCRPSVPLPPTDIPLESIARNTMMHFFANLNNAEYEDAALSYGGSYEILQGYNPDIDPDDKIALLKASCEFNGLLCMQIMTAAQVNVEDGLTFHYKVSYRGPDNKEFILGPCCGATETEMPPVRYFDVTVRCDQQDACLVMDLPPYVP